MIPVSFSHLIINIILCGSCGYLIDWEILRFLTVMLSCPSHVQLLCCNFHWFHQLHRKKLFIWIRHSCVCSTLSEWKKKKIQNIWVQLTLYMSYVYAFIFVYFFSIKSLTISSPSSVSALNLYLHGEKNHKSTWFYSTLYEWCVHLVLRKH